MPTGIYIRNKQDPRIRFWSKVNKLEPNECWPWTGFVNEHGYGKFAFNGRAIHAHQFSMYLKLGVPVKKGLCCLHSCDNRICVNPNHLSVGTHYDNVQDRVNRNRSRNCKGESHGRSKLKKEQVLEIRKSPLTAHELSSIYGVKHCTIWKIKKLRIWKHL